MKKRGLLRTARAAARVALKAARFAAHHEDAVVALVSRASAVLDDHRLTLSMIRVADRLLDIALHNRARLPGVLHDIDEALLGHLGDRTVDLAGSAARFAERQRALTLALTGEAKALLDGDELVPAARDFLDLLPRARAHAGEINSAASHLRSAAHKSDLVGSALRAARSGARVLDDESAAVTGMLEQGQSLLDTDLPAAGIALATQGLKLAVAEKEKVRALLDQLRALAGDPHAPELLRSTSALLGALIANTEAVSTLGACVEEWLGTADPAGWLAAVNALGRDHRNELFKLSADLLAIVAQEPHSAALPTLTDAVRLAWLESDALATGLAALRALDVIGEALSLDKLSLQLRGIGQAMILASYALAGTSAVGDTVKAPLVLDGDIPACPSPPPPPVLSALGDLKDKTQSVATTLGQIAGDLGGAWLVTDVNRSRGQFPFSGVLEWLVTDVTRNRDQPLGGAAGKLTSLCQDQNNLSADPLSVIQTGLDNSKAQVLKAAQNMYASGMAFLGLAAAIKTQ